MGEKVDFHLLEEEETSLFTLLAPDLRPCEPEKGETEKPIHEHERNHGAFQSKFIKLRAVNTIQLFKPLFSTKLR